MPEPLLIAKAKREIDLLPRFANRHGLIAGDSGRNELIRFSRIGPGEKLRSAIRELVRSQT